MTQFSQVKKDWCNRAYVTCILSLLSTYMPRLCTVYGLDVNTSSVDAHLCHLKIRQLHCWPENAELYLVRIGLELLRCTPMLNNNNNYYYSQDIDSMNQVTGWWSWLASVSSAYRWWDVNYVLNFLCICCESRRSKDRTLWHATIRPRRCRWRSNVLDLSPTSEK